MLKTKEGLDTVIKCQNYFDLKEEQREEMNSYNEKAR